MAKEFIISESDIDNTLDILLESPVNPYKKEITAITMGKFLARNPLSRSPRKANPAFADAPPPKQRNRKEFTEEQSRSVCAELTKFKEFVKLRGPNSNIPQEKFSAKEVRKLIQFIDARIDRFGFCDVKEGACSGGRVKNDEGECRCPPGYRWEPAKELSEVEGDVVPPNAEGKCVKDSGKPTKKVKADIGSYKWMEPQTDGDVDWLSGFKFKGSLDKSFGPLKAMFIEMFTFNRTFVALIKKGNLLTGDPYFGMDKEQFFKRFVFPREEQMKVLVNGLNLMTAAQSEGSSDDAKKAFENLSNELEEKKKILDTDSDLAKKFNAIKDEYLEKMFKEVEKMEENISETQTLQEGMLHSITIDFAEIRRKQKHLDESFLVMFGAWVKWLLEKMFGGGSIPGTIKGSKSEVESFARAMGSEKRYIETAKRYGLDHPTTYKSKAKLSSATKGFEKETGIKWPFE